MLRALFEWYERQMGDQSVTEAKKVDQKGKRFVSLDYIVFLYTSYPCIFLTILQICKGNKIRLNFFLCKLSEV